MLTRWGCSELHLEQLLHCLGRCSLHKEAIIKASTCF